MIDVYQKMCQTRVNSCLKQYFSPTIPEFNKLYEAMQYSVMLGGKRIRPLLVYSACEALGGSLDQADAAACAVELIHAYSLIHDDLPAMDDDDLRRGQPTTHKVFGEATAILAGDALQALAFEALTDNQSASSLQMVKVLAKAAGAAGMVGGQAIDLAAVGKKLNQTALEVMHSHKTGALIEASVVLGALASEKSTEQTLTSLTQYAKAIGLAFQVQDDILDIEGDTQTLGKQQGADIAHDKPTYPALMGLEQAKNYARQLQEEALIALKPLSVSADPLRALAIYIIERRY